MTRLRKDRFSHSARRRQLRSTERVNLRRCLVESLETRQLLAGDTVLFADSFENGQWAGKWVEDSQNDWFTSAQRATDGTHSADVDGSANDATLTLANPIDLSSYDTGTLTFDWLIESGFRSGEYLSLDISSDGGATWTQDVLRLDGNVDPENTWLSESVDLTPYASSSLKIQFRSKVGSSRADANVDKVQIVGTQWGPPEITITDATGTEGGSSLRVIDRFVTDGSGGLTRTRFSTFGPDANDDGEDDLYVSSADTNQILVFDGSSGAFIRPFANVLSPMDLQFSPTNGDLYVTTAGGYNIIRFDGQTGAYVDTPIDGFADRPRGLTFTEDGTLFFAVKGATNAVFRYDGSTVTKFIDGVSSGLVNPTKALFGTDGSVYVNSSGTSQIMKYDGTGSFIGVVATLELASAAWIDFDTNGVLYVSGRDTTTCCDTSIARVDASSGEVIDTYALGRDGWSFMVGPDNLIYSSTNDPTPGSFIDRIGPTSLATFDVSLSVPSNQLVTVDFTTADVSSAIAGSDYTPVSGTLVFAPGVTSQTIVVPTVDDSIEEGDETFVVDLSNATGATIADGQGTGTIHDDDVSPDPNVLYVFDIGFESKRAGRDWRAVFEIHVDSNANGAADAGDAAASGATLDVNFAGQTYLGVTTDGSGVYRTPWIKDLPSGDHYANALDVALAGFTWDDFLSLAQEDDSDGDGKPDALLSI